MSDRIDAGTARGSEGADSEGRLARILYRIAIFVLFCVAFYSTFEGLAAVSGKWFVAIILTGLFQGALLGTALVLGRDLADYASGSRSARISAGGRGVRYGLTGLIYVGCLLLCVFFAFTFWHRILLDRGTGLDITLPKITQLASKFVAGDLTVAVKENRPPKLAEWAEAVGRANKAASTEAIAKERAKAIDQAKIKAVADRDQLRAQLNATITAAGKNISTQSNRIETLKRTEDDDEKADDRVKALTAAIAAELGPKPPEPRGNLPENGDAFRLTKDASCKPTRKAGTGACHTALAKAREKTESKRSELEQAKRGLEDARPLLEAAEKTKAEAEKRLKDSPPLTPPTSPEPASGEMQLAATADHLDAFMKMPTTAAFDAVVQDCTTSVEALRQAKDPSADGIGCRPSELADFVARYEAYNAACGKGEPTREAETIQTTTRDELRRATDQSSRQQQQRVDTALRDTFANIVSPCIDKARAFGGEVAAKAGRIEDEARDFVSANVLDRAPQDRAFDAIKSLLGGSGGLPVYGAAFLAVLQEMLILCFSFLLHLADKDGGASAQRSAARPIPRAARPRTDLDWTPDPDRDPPRVLAAKFLHAALDIEPDGSGSLASDFAADAPKKVAVNACNLVKELARDGHIAKMRGGRTTIAPEGIALVEAIVHDHHDHHEATVSARPRPEPPPATPAYAHDSGLGADVVAKNFVGGEARPGLARGAESPVARSHPEGAAPVPDVRAEVAAPTRPGMAQPADPAPPPPQYRKGRPRDFGYAFRRTKD